MADLIPNSSFENGWDGFNDGAGGLPHSVIATDYAFDGTHSAKYAWTPNPGGDVGGIMYHSLGGGYDRVWTRIYFRLTTHISSVWKYQRFQTTGGGNFGGFFVQSGNTILSWGWDNEDQAIATSIGLTEARVCDGNWHMLEVDYQRNGGASGFPEASFRFDGQPVYAELNGHSTITYWGAGNQSYWQNGRLIAGMRASTAKIGTIFWMGTLNANNTTTGQSNIDLIAASSSGWLGP